MFWAKMHSIYGLDRVLSADMGIMVRMGIAGL
jgi:hypothetical protein